MLPKSPDELRELAKTPEDLFWLALEATPRDWFLLCNRAIRREPSPLKRYCPLTAACEVLGGRQHDFINYELAAVDIGLADGQAIADAADARDGVGHDVVLRARLLKACGLEGK